MQKPKVSLTSDVTIVQESGEKYKIALNDVGRKLAFIRPSSEIVQLIEKVKLCTSERELNQLAAHYKNITHQGVHPQAGYYSGEELISQARGENEWKLLFTDCQLSRSDKILNVGCSFGLTELWGLDHGYQCYGVEPDPVAAAIAGKLLSLSGYRASQYVFQEYGEKLHFKDDYFDVVVSLSTFEHVSCPELVIDEMLRVLKPGGFLVIVCPSYSSFWEPHYSLPWSPFFPKKIAKLYVRLLGRKTELIDEINFIKPSFFKKYFKTKHLEFKDLSEKLMLLMVGVDGSISNPFLGKILKCVGPLLLKSISALHVYPYIKFIVKKKLSEGLQ
ncbi:MAG: hypothetical protein A3D24_01895 [Candidatus Blackburnbacteria bacterium RIFCSPHIGHO2_02_FULL_39_13]|nr:MAG: hypothetical protein UT38_C0004G0020 [Microgenomates group bacterium GW2011_GWA2_39_19]OGY07359.1 MAG: hypothetical protein A2694_01110 [Candidatus Blackburnbacteria bacterium RIFCSPHIGHO2_01_FULL_40_17]OGY09153.1 MAG: hypothetical protein A3D24_01895 [Candidatus Blackburnbacteria bacterium RIFCSPHIGHO2_02_FULL_39_13]